MPQYTFSPPANGNMSPLAWYQTIRGQPGFIHDAAQEAAIAELDVLWHALIDFKNKRNHFLGRSLLSPDVPKGLYFWGGVGRGKSFLMDVFFACLPYKRKRRIHFHDFMAEAHHEMKLLSASKDPLLALADNIAKATRLLCFDELHVSDIADAMILGRLMAALFERGVVMIITSNAAPDDLYPNGLQRQKFLPAIELIKQNLKVINIDSGNDYRLREMPNTPLFMLSSASDSETHMEAIFQRLAKDSWLNKSHIEIQERLINVKKLASKIIWFNFADLCEGPRSQADYLEIAHRFPAVFISDIPQMGANEAAEAQRFIWLIDVLYDNRVKLVASAAVSPQQLCSNPAQTGEFSRTVSRLMEMQSQAYLELKHQTEIANLTQL
jgi:cell division protein ZapE